jgi:hypothetical protein
MYLSYSGWKKHDGCPFAYWNEYINRTPKDGVDDRLGSIYGSVVGKLFEYFYTLKVWKQDQPQAYLMGMVSKVVTDTIRRETTPWKDKPGGVILWKGSGPGKNPKGLYANQAELEADVRDAIPRGFQIIKQHRLLGPRTDAEYKLDFTTPDGDILGGRADFIIVRVKPFSDTLIVDGKGSRHRGKYVDPQQLQWYAMLFWLNAVKAGAPAVPDKLAFLFWRSSPEESMDWVDTSEYEVQAFYERVIETVKEIQAKGKMVLLGADPKFARGVFKPKASDQNCRFCPYASVCPPGAQVQERQKQR